MAIGSSLGITLPSQGGNENTWGTDLNTELQKIIDAVEAQVPASAIDFSADLDINGNALTGLAHTTYDGQGTAPSEVRSVYFNSTGDFYIRNGANQTVQITSGNSLSGAGGSVTGAGYGTSGVEINWDGTNYRFKNASGTDAYAPIRFDAALFRDGSGNEITMDAPSISSDYTITLPTAQAAGATTIVQSDASGNWSFSNTFSTDITLSGSAELKHGSRFLYVSAVSGFNAGGTPGTINVSAAEVIPGVDNWMMPIPLDQGDRIVNVYIYVYTGAAASITCYLLSKSTCDGSAATVEGSQVSVGTGTQTVTIATPNHTIGAAADNAVILRIACTNASDRILGARVEYDRP